MTNVIFAIVTNSIIACASNDLVDAKLDVAAWAASNKYLTVAIEHTIEAVRVLNQRVNDLATYPESKFTWSVVTTTHNLVIPTNVVLGVIDEK